MEDLNAQGGSYEQQEDGSLKLVSRTKEPKPSAEDEGAEPKASAKGTKPGKDVTNG